MSFDIYIGAFKGGEATTFDRSIVEDAFQSLIAFSNADGWQLMIPGWGVTGGFLYIDDTPQITDFAVNRPPFGPEFVEALFSVLRQTPTVLFWPGVGPHPRACVADASVIAELPPDMIESLGNPTVVSSGAEMDDCISLSA
jgi:hypothetical protein